MLILHERSGLSFGFSQSLRETVFAPYLSDAGALVEAGVVPGVGEVNLPALQGLGCAGSVVDHWRLSHQLRGLTGGCGLWSTQVQCSVLINVQLETVGTVRDWGAQDVHLHYHTAGS